MGNKRYHTTKFQVYLNPDEAWECIEMGKNPDELYPESWNIKPNTTLLEELLLDGEEFILLDDMLNGYAITNLWRMWSLERHNQVIPTFFQTCLQITLRSRRINFQKMVKKKFGIEGDLENLRDIYNQNKWQYYIYDNGKKRNTKYY